jgi:hypothetical protein
MPTGETLAALQQAAVGLTYPSDTDAPWTAFAWPDATGTPTGEEVRRRGKQKPGAPIEEQSLDALFAPLVQLQDWFGDQEKADAAKNQALLDAIKRLLPDPKVIRIGERKVAVYVIGQAKEGGWAGLKTTAVET